MKPCSWKVFWSYIVDISIERSHSPYHKLLEVVLSKGRYQLRTSRAIYSYEDLYDNFGTLFREKINCEKLPGNKVLILGLGLASIPVILESLEDRTWEITAVDIDEEICRLANEYVLPRIKSPVEVFIADADNYMHTLTTKFDLICVDLFMEDEVPENFKSLEFLRRLRSGLNSGGLIVYNTLAYSSEDKKSSREFFEKCFNIIFEKAKYLLIHRNYMLLSDESFLL